MRVESTDAQSMMLTKVANSNTGTETKESQSKPHEKNNMDNKKISQLTEIERNDLPLSEKVVINAIEKANKAITGVSTKFEFSIHEKTKEIMVKVINSETNEVIREIPPEKILDLVAKMWEMAGIIVDERR